jgi:hypothetical protein
VRALTLGVLAALAGCASIPHPPPRLDGSSYGCMSAVLKQKVPTNLPDKRTHCLAPGLIARYCSLPEAYLAGIGKEVRDLLGPGDFEWADWQADRVGIACARRAESDPAVASCCGENPR